LRLASRIARGQSVICLTLRWRPIRPRLRPRQIVRAYT